MQDQFGSARPALKYLREIQDLKQADDEPIQKYYCQMILLLKRAKIDLDTQTAVDYVISGLKPSLATRVYSDADKYLTCDALFKKLRLLDEAEAHRKRVSDDNDDLIMAVDERRSSPDEPRRPPDEQRRLPERGFRKNQPQSYNRRAEALRRAPEPSRYRRPATPPARRVQWQDRSPERTEEERSACWTCGGSGHWHFECPTGAQSFARRSSSENEQRGSPSRWSSPAGEQQQHGQRPQNGQQKWSASRNSQN